MMTPDLMSMRAALVGLRALLLGLVLALGALGALAQTGVRADFDHLGTGFALSGAHAVQRCESCHGGGQFKGTPRTCDTCHLPGSRHSRGNVVMPPTHYPTAQPCDACHTTRTFAGDRFNHVGVNRGTCQTCHSGSMAVGKPASHIQTSASCDSCHRVAAWSPATGFNHTGVAKGSCASCHNGATASGKSANHLPTEAKACDDCHRGSFTSWANGRFHGYFTVTTGCASCHTGTFQKAVGKPGDSTHAGLSGACESCHKSTTTWLGARVDHATFTSATNCSSCHAAAKTATHVPTAANCFTCHNTSPARWKPAKWNHTQVVVAAQCASCHTGGFPPADGRPANHIPYASIAAAAGANCDTCHRGGYSAWTPALFHGSVAVSSQCATCHSGAFAKAVGKPVNSTHATVTGNCESCHKSTATWGGAKVDHATFTSATNCSTCHASAKTATHVPTTANCFTCHNVSPAPWKPTKWNHTQVPVAAQCAGCHTGGFPPADGKSANHIPYQAVAVSAAANCDACHKGSFTTWANGRFHGNYTVATGCATCHSGAFQNAVGKPATPTHATVTGGCEACHKSTVNWAAAAINHSTFTSATNCGSCHAADKTATHMPTTANCFTCHNVSPAPWKPTKWNHTQVPVAAQCAGCHTGGFPPADGKSANHIPYQAVAVSAAANCDACHKGSFTTWANGRFHGNYTVATGCATCHSGAFQNAVGKPATPTHATVTGGCEACHKSTVNWAAAAINHSTFTSATNCGSCHAADKTATHMPTTANCFTCHNVAPAPWKPTKWNHTQTVVAGQCASCHNGGYPPADGKPANHVPYQTVAVSASANCDACHRGSFATWANGRFHSYYSVTSGCKTCHSGAFMGARGLSANHVPLAQLLNGSAMECNACHTSTTSWQTLTMNHNNSQGNGSGWCRGCHASGTNYAGGMERKALTHERSTGVTDCSQSGCHRPLGTRGTTYRNWD